MAESEQNQGITALNDFCDYLTLERRVSVYTVRNYRSAVESFVTWIAGHKHWQGDFSAIVLECTIRHFLGAFSQSLPFSFDLLLLVPL